MSGDHLDIEKKYISLKVLGQDNMVTHFKIKKNTPLGKLMSLYCKRENLPAEVARFRIDGEPITEDQTSDLLELQEGDTIEVYVHQDGGSLITNL